jgi:hypothetical protein
MSDYEIADRKDSRALTEFLQKEGQFRDSSFCPL